MPPLLRRAIGINPQPSRIKRVFTQQNPRRAHPNLSGTLRRRQQRLQPLGPRPRIIIERADERRGARLDRLIDRRAEPNVLRIRNHPDRRPRMRPRKPLAAVIDHDRLEVLKGLLRKRTQTRCQGRPRIQRRNRNNGLRMRRSGQGTDVNTVLLCR